MQNTLAVSYTHLVGYVLHYNPLFMTAKKLQKAFIGNLFYEETDYFHRVMSDITC